MGVTVTACRNVHRRQLSLWRNAGADIWETRVGIWRLITLIIPQILLNLWVTNLRVSFQSWMDCVIKSASVTFIRAAAALIQTRHICQICALWKFLSGFSIFCNYVQSDAIKSHSFQFSDPISVLQHKSAKSVFQFSGPNFWQILATKKVEWGRNLCRIRVTGLHFE